jgi:DnaJ-class molecular chaperone
MDKAVDEPKSDPQQYDSREVFQAFFADHDPFSKLTVHDIHPFKSYKKLENTSTKKVSEDKNESNIELKCTLEDFFWGCEKRIKIERKNLCTKEEKDLTVRIEAGMKEGSSIVLRNEGDDRGDLVCTLKEQKHELFERDGSCSNLIYYCRISLLHALTGTSIKVPTLSGRILLLALPEVVHSKYERIVKGEGMPIYIGDKSFRGDLIIRFDVQYPKLNYTVREHLRALLCDVHERMD